MIKKTNKQDKRVTHKIYTKPLQGQTHRNDRGHAIYLRNVTTPAVPDYTVA